MRYIVPFEILLFIFPAVEIVLILCPFLVVIELHIVLGSLTLCVFHNKVYDRWLKYCATHSRKIIC